MITILFHVTIKDGKEQDFHDIVESLTEITRAEDEGCLAYVWHQRQDMPKDYVLYEQWRDQEAIDAHIEHLQALYGPPYPGKRKGLPAALLDLFENTQGVLYDVVA